MTKYAVIFTSTLTGNDAENYEKVSAQMEADVEKMEGFVEWESARSDLGIFISYWDSLDAIKRWAGYRPHTEAKKEGVNTWYSWYKIRICEILEEREFTRAD